MGVLISASYFSLRGWNQSRRLLRLSARRNFRASGEKPGNVFFIWGAIDNCAIQRTPLLLKDVCRPAGAHLFYACYPGLPAWARLFRACGAGQRVVKKRRHVTPRLRAV